MSLLVALTGDHGGLVRVTDGGVERLLEREHASLVLAADGTAYVLTGSDKGRLLVVGPHGETAEHRTGAEPCHAALTADGALLLTADYTSGTLTVLRRLPDGSLEPVETITLEGRGSGVDPDRQEAPHPHYVLWHGDRALVADLGSDAVLILERSGETVRVTGRTPTPPGSGPRHLLVVGDLLAVTAELSGELLVAPLAEVLMGATTWRRTRASVVHSEARVYPSDLVKWGGGVAVANRGAGTIAVIEITAGDPVLRQERPSGGSWPQQLLVADDGRLLIAQRDDDAVVAMDPDGTITRVAALPAPAWIARP